MSKKRIIYYTDLKGESPVRDNIYQLSIQEQQKIFAYVTLLEEQGENLRRPIADYVGDKLYELRPQSYRVLYFFLLREYAVVVHIFRKKTDRIPGSDKRVALKRMKDFLDRYEQKEIIITE